MATKKFKIRPKLKKKKIFNFLLFFFICFLNEIYRPKNEIYHKNAQKIGESAKSLDFLNLSLVKQNKFRFARCIALS